MKTDKDNTWIICFSGYWDQSSLYGVGNIVLKFYEDNHKILWINSIPNRSPSIKRAGSKRSLFKNIIKKLKHHLNFIKKEKKGFYILTPFYIPFPENKYIYKINLYILRKQVSLIKFLFSIKQFILIASSTVDTKYLFPKRNFIKYFHYIADLYSDYREASEDLKNKLRNREKKIFNYADYLLVSSYRVLEKVSNIVFNKKKIIYFPHGVDYKHFNNVNKNTPFSMSNIPKPIVGYYGSLTMANNQDVYLALAEAGYSVVLIGRVTGDYDRCSEHPNIYLLGPIPYKDLPIYANQFDVAIMAWKPSEWILNSNPKKTFEYLAQGKPIVCNKIPEIERQLKEFVYFAETPEEFVTQCKKAIEENSTAKIEVRKLRAKQEDWNEKYKKILSLL